MSISCEFNNKNCDFCNKTCDYERRGWQKYFDHKLTNCHNACKPHLTQNGDIEAAKSKDMCLKVENESAKEEVKEFVRIDQGLDKKAIKSKDKKSSEDHKCVQPSKKSNCVPQAKLSVQPHTPKKDDKISPLADIKENSVRAKLDHHILDYGSWVCLNPKCYCCNFPKNNECIHCHMPKANYRIIKERIKKEVAEKKENWVCDSCFNYNFDYNVSKCHKCGMSKMEYGLRVGKQHKDSTEDNDFNYAK